MVTPKPPAFRPPNVETVPTPRSNMMAWLVIGGIVLLFILLGQCSTRHGADNSLTADTNYAADMSNSIAAQGPPPAPEPLNAASINRGASHLRTAFAAEGFSGAMIYSQNCYDALARHFAWAKLDQCGAFDMLTARSIATADTTGLDNEAAWFDSETASQRYLAAATGASQPAEEADRRLSDLQSRVAHLRTIGRRAAPEAANDDAFDPEPPYVDVDGNPIRNTSITADMESHNTLDQRWLDRAINRPTANAASSK